MMSKPQALASNKAIARSIVIGALNEERYIGSTLVKLSKFLKQHKLWATTEVVIVIPPGKDNTYKVVKSALDTNLFKHHQVLRPKTRVGKGRDIRLGVLASHGQAICFMDADGATPMVHLAKLFKELESGRSDVVFGKRHIWQMHNGLLRNVSSGLSNLVIRMFAGLGIQDSQCGFKGFTRQAAKDLFVPLEAKQWAFDIELYVRAQAHGYRLTWLPISKWQDPKSKDDGLAGEKQLGAMLSTGRTLLQIAFRRFHGYYLPRRQQKVRRGILLSMLIAVVWYLALHAVSIMGFGLVGTDQPNVQPVRPGLHQAVYTFDSAFYGEIVQKGYTGTGSIKHLAFYPLYPALLRLGQTVTLHQLDLKTTAFMINGLFVVLTATVLYALSARLKIARPLLVVLAWLLFPWSMFMGALYTEALFCFLIASSVLLVMKQRWYAAALVAGLASATRLPGALVGVLVLVEYLRQVVWPALRTKDSAALRKSTLALGALGVLSFSGLIAWLSYQWRVFGSPFAFQQAYKVLWTYQVFSPNIVAPLAKSSQIAIDGLMEKNVKAQLFEVGSWVFAAFIAFGALVAKLKIPKSWYVFIAANLVLILLNSNTVSVNRYILPIMVLYPMLILLIEKLPKKLVTPTMFFYLSICVLVQLLMAVRMVNFAWVG